MKKTLSALLALLLAAGCTASAPSGAASSAAGEEEQAVSSVTEETEEETEEEVTEEENTEEQAGEEETAEEEVPVQEGTDAAQATEGLSILCPTGAPAIAMIPVMKSGLNTVDTVEGADNLQAAFVNPDPQYDVIVAPTNLGVKLASAGKTTYRLLAVVDWGNLYIVGNAEDALENGTVAAFGEQAVPGLVFKKAYPEAAEKAKWFSAVDEARAELLAGNADAALLAEPAATASIAKAKQDGLELSIISNVQEVWGGSGFPMASLFVREDLYAENAQVYENLVGELTAYAETVDPEDPSALIEDITAITPEKLGVPNAEIVGKCYKRINVKITPADLCKEDIRAFMEIFDVTDIDAAFLN
ncbi:MAG: hypothetical protein K6G61_05945 [Solobacterium sp.]|nr:hypothetical protein [Solobacterium sp.]